MNLWNRFKIAAQFLGGDDENLREWVRLYLTGEDVGSYSGSSMNINKKTSLKFSAVFGCVRVLGETIASLPLHVYRKTEDGDRVQVNDILLADMLKHEPNPNMTPFAFKEQLMAGINLWGNSFAQKVKNRSGDLLYMYPVPSSAVEIDFKDDGKKSIVYKIQEGGEIKEYTREQIFHVPGISLDGVVGITPIEYAKKAIELGLQYQDADVSFYKNGANPSGTVELDGEMKDGAFERFKKDFEKSYQGFKNFGKPIILEGGAKYNPLTMKRADAQFIENRRFQVEDIARMYRVPLHLIQDLSRSTNNNIEHQSLEFAMYTCLPIVRRIEEAMMQQLLSRSERMAGYYVMFNMSGLLRGDSKSRAESYAIGRQNGWLSINDIRRLEDMNEVEGGDEYMQPLNYINVKLADDYHMKRVNGSSSTQASAEISELAEKIQAMIERK